MLRISSSSQFRRGDDNDNGTVDVADVSPLLNYIFGINTNIPCHDSADCNDDGAIDITRPDGTPLAPPDAA